MAINVTKPSVNLREKLNELDYAKVPFQKMPAGSVLQVVECETYSDLYTSSTTPVTAFTLNISPKSESSKIVVACQGGKMNFNTSGTSQHLYSIWRNDVQVGSLPVWADSGNYDLPLNIIATDSPNTTSTISYHLKGAVSSGAGWIIHATATYVPVFYAMEIAQ